MAKKTTMRGGPNGQKLWQGWQRTQIHELIEFEWSKDIGRSSAHTRLTGDPRNTRASLVHREKGDDDNEKTRQTKTTSAPPHRESSGQSGPGARPKLLIAQLCFVVLQRWLSIRPI